MKHTDFALEKSSLHLSTMFHALQGKLQGTGSKSHRAKQPELIVWRDTQNDPSSALALQTKDDQDTADRKAAVADDEFVAPPGAMTAKL